MSTWKLTLGCLLLVLVMVAQFANAASVSEALQPIHENGFKTNLAFSEKIGNHEYFVFEANYFENGTVIDADIVLIKVDKTGDAKMILRDESLIGLSDYHSVSVNVREKLLMEFAQKVMERDFGGKEAFILEAQRILADGSAHPDLVFIFTEYLKIKK